MIDAGVMVTSGPELTFAVTVVRTAEVLLDVAVIVAVPGATPVSVHPLVDTIELFDDVQLNEPGDTTTPPRNVLTVGVRTCWPPTARDTVDGDMVTPTAGPLLLKMLYLLPSGELVENDEGCNDW